METVDVVVLECTFKEKDGKRYLCERCCALVVLWLVPLSDCVRKGTALKVRKKKRASRRRRRRRRATRKRRNIEP